MTTNELTRGAGQTLDGAAHGTAPLPPRPAAVEWSEAAARALHQLRDGLLRQATELAELRAERDQLRRELAETRAQLAAAQTELGCREAFVAHTLELTSLVRMFELAKTPETRTGAESPAAGEEPQVYGTAAPASPAPASPATQPSARATLTGPGTTTLVWPGSAVAPEPASHHPAERLPVTMALRPLAAAR